MKKRILSMLLAIVMVVGLLPTAAFAVETTYDLWVGGVQVTSANKDDITTAITEAGGTADGTATYDPESEILTLNGFSYTGQGYVYDYDSSWCAAIYTQNDNLTVKVVGSNTVTASVTGDYTAEALKVGGALTITGDSGSSLSLTGAGRGGVVCIGDLNIENVTVNATGTSGLRSDEGNITIHNAIVHATATTGSGNYEGAIVANEKNITIENSKVTATAISGYAININGTDYNTCTIKNSNVTISNAKYGIRLTSYANLKVENSTLTITATEKAIYAFGGNSILVDNHLVHAGNDAASAVKVDSPTDATYANKYVRIVPSQKHTLCQTANCTIDHNGNASGTGHADADKITFTPVTTQDELQDAATNGGSVYLTNDIGLDETITVTGTLNLCLNGKKLYYTGLDNVSIFTVAENATLNITDCGTTARAGYVEVDGDGDTLLWNEGTGDGNNDITYDLVGGLITGGTGTVTSGTTRWGGAVYAQAGATVNLYGGNIAGNSANYGGCIHGVDCTMNMYGGSIVGNIVGGIHLTSDYSNNIDSSLNIHGGNIEYNLHNGYSASEVGVTGTITMTGGRVIAENTMVALHGTDGFTMTGGEVINYAQDGVAVSVQDTWADLSGGTISAPNDGIAVSSSIDPLYGHRAGDIRLSGAPVLEGDAADISIMNGKVNGESGDYQNHIVLEGPLTGSDPYTVAVAILTWDTDEYDDLIYESLEIDENPTIDFTKGWSTHMGNATPAAYFENANTAEGAKPISLINGELWLATTYTVTADPTEHGTVATDPDTAAAGETVTITATPDEGYEVDAVAVYKTGDDTTIVTVTNGEFTMPAYSVTVSVTFKEIPAPAPAPTPTPTPAKPRYPVVEQNSGDSDGTVSFSKSRATRGSTVTVTVTPDKYYGVEKVIVRDASGKEIETTKNADGTYSFKMPYGKVTVEAVYVWENPFVDVEEETFYIDAVEWALKNGITEGTSETTFSPMASCTRSQMVTFLWRAAGCPEPSRAVCAFTDVNIDSYYGKAVLWALEKGITNGTSETAFSPDMECSRAQMAAFLCRMADGKAESDTIAFTDVKADAYYAESVQWAVENGVTEGTGEGMYSPDAVCTRGQMVTFLYRYYVK